MQSNHPVRQERWEGGRIDRRKLIQVFGAAATAGIAASVAGGRHASTSPPARSSIQVPVLVLAQARTHRSQSLSSPVDLRQHGSTRTMRP